MKFIYILYRIISPSLKIISINLGLSHGQCRFTPTCSLYAKEAYHKHNVLTASWFVLIRLIQCHPWSKGGYDPVP